VFRKLLALYRDLQPNRLFFQGTSLKRPLPAHGILAMWFSMPFMGPEHQFEIFARSKPVFSTKDAVSWR
jgi:hypothetical protein